MNIVSEEDILDFIFVLNSDKNYGYRLLFIEIHTVA